VKRSLQKKGGKRQRRSHPSSSESSSDSDVASDQDKDKGKKGALRDSSPDSSPSDTDVSSDTSTQKAHKGKSKKNGHVVKYGLPPMPMFDGSLKPGEGDDKIPDLGHWFGELRTRAKRLDMPLIELLSTQTIASAKRWTINEMKKDVHKKLYHASNRKASNKAIRVEFFKVNLRHLKLKKIRDMGKLLRGSIKQLPNEQVSQYVLRFRTQLGEADCGNYAEDSRMNSILCFYFREGLLPHLRKFAHSDDKAQPFVDLEKLINHIYGKEDEVMDMASTADTSGRLAAYTQQRPTRNHGAHVSYPQGGRGRGRGGRGGGSYGGGGYGAPGVHSGTSQQGSGGRGGMYVPPYMMSGPGPMLPPPARIPRSPYAPPLPPWQEQQHRGGQSGATFQQQQRQQGSLKSRAILAMRAAYSQRRPGQDCSDTQLTSWFNHYNKHRMCPVCETSDHHTKRCPILHPPSVPPPAPSEYPSEYDSEEQYMEGEKQYEDYPDEEFDRPPSA
jgi:hypothetical protein